MQLDRTRIPIRPRTLLEIFDLALRVTWNAWPMVYGSLLIGAIPWAIANGVALHWMVAREYSNATISRYVTAMILFIFWESSLATLPTTVVLGRFMFLRPTDWRSVAKDLRECFGRIFWTQGVRRAGLVGVWALVECRESLDASMGERLIWMLVFYQGILRAMRPFLNEIVVLERNPLRAQAGRTMTIARRNQTLHQPSYGDHFGRFLATGLACGAMAANLLLTGWFISGTLTNSWNWGPWTVQLLLPTALWLVVGFATVVRYLSYLDLRIRREGWEVELRVRAAASELQGEVAR